MKSCPRCRQPMEEFFNLRMSNGALETLDFLTKVQSAQHGRYYTIEVCRRCKDAWSQAIKDWFELGKIHGNTK